jgi:hypothetical protein
MSKIKELAKPQEKENTEQSEYDIQTLDDYLLNRPMGKSKQNKTKYFQIFFSHCFFLIQNVISL